MAATRPTKAFIKRACEAAVAAGLHVVRIEATQDGPVVLYTGTATNDDADLIFEQWNRSNASS